MDMAKFFLSRRGLIASLGGAAAAGVLVAAQYRAVIAVYSLADGGVEQWLEQVGSTFTVGGGTSLKLIGVSALSSPGPRPAGVTRSRAFVAKFDVQNNGTMAGDLIYTASHARYGAFRIFLSASTDPQLPHRMTALFN
jgi:hypothetical protein